MNVSRDRSLECIPLVKQIPHPPTVPQPQSTPPVPAPPRPGPPPGPAPGTGGQPNPAPPCRPSHRGTTEAAHQPRHNIRSSAVTAATPPIRCGCVIHVVLTKCQ